MKNKLFGRKAVYLFVPNNEPTWNEETINYPRTEENADGVYQYGIITFQFRQFMRYLTQIIQKYLDN